MSYRNRRAGELARSILDAIMRAGDELVVLGRTDSIKALEKGVLA